ncbi:hypothetical protein ECANGB1_973 [Enterospora canceri]|uniref:Uncharacterized protein n=1 Tax=Enterospora canceri TaxID=1081671 RepID=A0A1Y1S728_9MICR|nr:hypothetical protein ECANGB1_973 [Enterospora canceri]
MLTFLRAVLAVQTKCSSKSMAYYPGNELNNKIIPTVYTCTDSSDDLTQLTKSDGHFESKVCPEYAYALAFATTKKALATGVAYVWIEVNTTKLLNDYKATKTQAVDLGSVFTTMAKLTDTSVPVDLSGAYKELNGNSLKVGFYLKLTKAEFENIEYLYFARLSPITEIDVTQSADYKTLDITYKSEVITTGGQSTRNVKSDSINKKVNPETSGRQFDPLVLNELKRLLDDNSSENCEMISDSMLGRICFVNEDIKLTNAINDVIGCEWVDPCCVDDAVQFECNFINFCNTAVASICTTKASGQISEPRVVEVCKKSPAPRNMYTLCALVNFYNCNFYNCSFSFDMITQIHNNYGKTICTPLALEDFCEMFGVDIDSMDEFDEEMMKELKKKEAEKKKKKTTSKKSEEKKEGFFSKHKTALLVTGGVVAAAVVGGSVYMFLL